MPSTPFLVNGSTAASRSVTGRWSRGCQIELDLVLVGRGHELAVKLPTLTMGLIVNFPMDGPAPQRLPHRPS